MSKRSLSLLTKNDIIELQRHCYFPLEDVTVLHEGVEKTFKVGSQISDSSYFDIYKFAQLLEERVLDRLETSEFPGPM